MLAGLDKLLDNTQARNISLVSFMRAFSEINDKGRILAFWTGEAIPYLQRHSAFDKRERGTYLRKFTTSELEAMVDKELAERNHVEALIPSVSQQELAVSKLHAKRIGYRCHAEMTSIVPRKRGRGRISLSQPFHAGPSNTAPTSSSTSSPTSRPRINDPWHDLVQATLYMYEKKDVDLPSEKCAEIEQDPERNTLYKLALSHLQNAQEEMQEPKFDKTSCTDFKDAFVALSGVWNVFSEEANKAFQSTDRQEVEELCRMTELENKDPDVMEILTALIEKSQQVPLRHVVHPHNGSMAPSEADSMYLWAKILDEGMPLNTSLSFHLGEQGCAATALSKSQLSKVFDIGTSARKCDCIFTVKGLEVGNIEAKRNSATKFEVMCQLRKNIKINKSILLQLEKYEVECPPLLSIHGNTAIVFRVRRWRHIFVVSKACPTLVLPTTADEWPLFLTRQAHVLNNLLKHYHAFSLNCAMRYNIVQYENQAALEDELVSFSSEVKATLLEWEHVVLHTPTKPKQDKKMSLGPQNKKLSFKPPHLWEPSLFLEQPLLKKIDDVAKNYKDEYEEEDEEGEDEDQ
ncbi:hypothetical protein BGZ76_003473 [Entomortierella beljakovae]|nr:hypothetical protein BGZ76_003473 [Entomortierella beljakovae]